MRARSLYPLLLSAVLAWFVGPAAAQDYYDEDNYDDYDGRDYYGQEQPYATPDAGSYDNYSIFYDALAPYGDWFWTDEYGYVWIPWVDHTSWRPYADDGHWEWSDYGWTWVSDYDWGWAPFHYGRWLYLDGTTWVWIPDLVWGPAWVAWRYTDSYVGWSPLTPGAYWYPDDGLEVTTTIPWDYWIFVPGTEIFQVNIHVYVVPRPRLHWIYYHSRPATVYRIASGIPVNVGIDIRRVARWTGRPVRQVNVVISGNPVGRTTVQRGSLVIYRPPARVIATRRIVAPPPPRRAAPAALVRIAPAPPPPRAGLAPSQSYKARVTVEKRTVAPRTVAPRAVEPRTVEPRKVAPRTVEPAVVEPRAIEPRKAAPGVVEPRSSVERELRQDREELRQDRQELRQRQEQLREDRHELREQRRAAPRDSESVQRATSEVKQSRQAVQEQRKEAARERHEQRKARREQRQNERDRD